MKNKKYRLLDPKQFYIDKAAGLEKGITAFPSIYIEGAAATGKTTALRMLLEHHPEVEYSLYHLGEKEEAFLDVLKNELPILRERMLALSPASAEMSSKSRKSDKNGMYENSNQRKKFWIILEDLNSFLSQDICREIKEFILNMPENGRMILVGRECPQEFLPLIWKREMELIPQSMLMFSRDEVREYTEKCGSVFNPEEVYKATGGWPGCVDMLIRFFGKAKNKKTITELLCSYEISTYVEREILETLSEEEKKLVSAARICPWMTEELCRQVWNMENTEEILKKLQRKGILHYNKFKEYYTLPELFDRPYEMNSKEKWMQLADWYVRHNHIREAFLCVKKVKDETFYRAFLMEHYSTIPFVDVNYGNVMDWKSRCPEACYLRALHNYQHGDIDNFKQELNCLEKWNPGGADGYNNTNLNETAGYKDVNLSEAGKMHRKNEIYLNLMYVNPEVPLVQWMNLLEEMSKDGEKYRIYSMLGNGYSFLCGLRDISGLFACTKKEELRLRSIWKNGLSREEWVAYCLARVDFYMETKQKDKLREEDHIAFRLAIGKLPEDDINIRYKALMWRFRQAGLYLLCKWPELEEVELPVEYIHEMGEQLIGETLEISAKNTEAIISLYSPWHGESEILSYWLLQYKDQDNAKVLEENYMMLFGRAKGYIFQNHYEKAELILERLLPYLQKYHRYRYFAEALFGMAIIEWNRERSGHAIRYMMESILVTGNSRYVNFYTRYGQNSYDMIEGYLEWLKNTQPEKWHRKKKYNYGNVLRMPLEDYLNLLLRDAKKERKIIRELPENENIERLTMMETLVLHSISRGLTNTQICEEQNLKLPTVKSHLYSLYKKLGVNSRVQAINKGKEMGLIR